jgi:hypothetical protein
MWGAYGDIGEWEEEDGDEGEDSDVVSLMHGDASCV